KLRGNAKSPLQISRHIACSHFEYQLFLPGPGSQPDGRCVRAVLAQDNPQDCFAGLGQQTPFAPTAPPYCRAYLSRLKNDVRIRIDSVCTSKNYLVSFFSRSSASIFGRSNPMMIWPSISMTGIPICPDFSTASMALVWSVSTFFSVY